MASNSSMHLYFFSTLSVLSLHSLFALFALLLPTTRLSVSLSFKVRRGWRHHRRGHGAGRRNLCGAKWQMRRRARPGVERPCVGTARGFGQHAPRIDGRSFSGYLWSSFLSNVFQVINFYCNCFVSIHFLIHPICLPLFPIFIWWFFLFFSFSLVPFAFSAFTRSRAVLADWKHDCQT